MSVVLSWSAAPGAGYEVQFKNNLTDPAWQPLGSPTAVVGAKGQAIDSSPEATHRFYRIIPF